MFGIENNGFQELFVNELIQKSTKAHAYIQIEPVGHSTNKRARIEGLESLTFSDVLRPAIIRFRRDYETAYPLLIDQLLKFPNAAMTMARMHWRALSCWLDGFLKRMQRAHILEEEECFKWYLILRAAAGYVAV